MIPYYLLLLIPFFFIFVDKDIKNKKYIVGRGGKISENNPAILVFFFLLWFLLVCRSVEIGKDTKIYEMFFFAHSDQTVEQLLNDDAEPLFRLLNWFIGRFTDNFQMYLAIIVTITLIPMAVLYNQDKRHNYLKIVLFVNMSNFVMLFSGIRQSIAISIGLIAFHYVKKKKIIAFLITVAIAIGIHTSAFMLVAMYPLYYIRLKKKHTFIVIPLIAIVYIFNRQIFAWLLNVMSLLGTRFDSYEGSDTGAVTMIILFAMLTIFSYIIPDDSKTDDEFIGMRNYLLLATLLQCFAPLHTLAMRMNYYYIIFIPVVIPRVLNCAGERERKLADIAETVMCLFFTAYFVMNIISSMKTGGVLHTVPYIPFWHDN